MAKIKKVTKTTENPFLNMYELDRESKTGKKGKYYVASRAKDVSRLKLNTKKNNPDGVIIYSLYGENQDKVVLIRQYRYSIDDYIYEFPAGLVEENEDYREAAAREMKEETGLEFRPMDVNPAYEKPAFTGYRHDRRILCSSVWDFQRRDFPGILRRYRGNRSGTGRQGRGQKNLKRRKSWQSCAPTC